jgi:hypothetical protein
MMLSDAIASFCLYDSSRLFDAKRIPPLHGVVPAE